jgi:hypothetical protein
VIGDVEQELQFGKVDSFLTQQFIRNAGMGLRLHQATLNRRDVESVKPQRHQVGEVSHHPPPLGTRTEALMRSHYRRRSAEQGAERRES